MVLKSLKILGRKVKIKYLSNAAISKEDDDKDEVHGLYSSSKNTIYINKDSDIEVQKLTLVHEIMHAYLGISGVAQILNSEKEEEAIVVCLENCLEMFRNKDLIKVLQK